MWRAGGALMERPAVIRCASSGAGTHLERSPATLRPSAKEDPMEVLPNNQDVARSASGQEARAAASRRSAVEFVERRVECFVAGAPSGPSSGRSPAAGSPVARTPRPATPDASTNGTYQRREPLSVLDANTLPPDLRRRPNGRTSSPLRRGASGRQRVTPRGDTRTRRSPREAPKRTPAPSGTTPPAGFVMGCAPQTPGSHMAVTKPILAPVPVREANAAHTRCGTPRRQQSCGSPS